MSEILNILNGQEMYNYYVKHHLNINGNYAPFNEAMCVGDVSLDIFSNEFILKRCKAHSVSQEEYQNITIEPLKCLFEKDFSDLFLWFDDDMFCQINFLTILAYLDQINHPKKVTLILVTKDFKFIDTYEIDVKGYYDLYKQVLIDHELIQEVSLSPLKKGIQLYLEYIKEDNEILRFIQQNKYLQPDMLLNQLFQSFPQYGLGDTQFIHLINKI